MKTKLYLLTSSFPFEDGESFLAVEFPFLATSFNEIDIISISNKRGIQPELPKNCQAFQLNATLKRREKFFALKGVFNSLFWSELMFFRSIYNLQVTRKVIATMLISLYRAKRIKRFLNLKLRNDNESFRCYFYSYWTDDRALALAFLKDEFPEIVCFSRLHGWDVYFERSAINYLPYRKKIQLSLNKLFSISEHGMEYAKRFWGVNQPEKITVSRLGVVVQNFIPAKEKSPFLIVSCASFITIKRIDLLIESLALLNAYDIKWIHFGEGELRDSLERKAKNQLNQVLQFEFKGQQSNAAILDFYRKERPHLFINTSSSEGIPVSIMEAMSFGIPTIATDVGGTSEIVTSKNGCLLPANPSSTEIKDAILEIMNSSDGEFDNKCRAAYETCQSKFNAEVNFNQFIRAILELKT